MTRRVFGRAGGFVAGLALALTPTAVAIFRHNNPDAALVLCITLAMWATVRGLQDGRTRWLVLAGVAVGLGFEAKMAAALLVVPAIVAAWLWVRPGGGLVRTARQLIAFGVASAGVGLAWAVAVWLTPAADRPWISGTSDNSIWSLILGYNGLGDCSGRAAVRAAAPVAQAAVLAGAAACSAERPARCACSMRRSAARAAGSWERRSVPACCSSWRRGFAVATPAPGGW